MQIKSSADNFELNYCYRVDGGKFSALDADKTGLIYIGFIYINYLTHLLFCKTKFIRLFQFRNIVLMMFFSCCFPLERFSLCQ